MVGSLISPLCPSTPHLSQAFSVWVSATPLGGSLEGGMRCTWYFFPRAPSSPLPTHMTLFVPVVDIFQIVTSPKSKHLPFICLLLRTLCLIKESYGTMKKDLRYFSWESPSLAWPIWPIGNSFLSFYWQILGVRSHPNIKTLPNSTAKQWVNLVPVLGHSAPPHKLQESCNNSLLSLGRWQDTYLLMPFTLKVGKGLHVRLKGCCQQHGNLNPHFGILCAFNQGPSQNFNFIIHYSC